MPWPELVLLVGVALAVLANVRIVQEGDRLVVFRLGRFHRILGPGLSLVLWRLDSARRVQLDAVVRDWQSLTPEQLDARLQQMAVTGQLPPIR